MSMYTLVRNYIHYVLWEQETLFETFQQDNDPLQRIAL